MLGLASLEQISQSSASARCQNPSMLVKFCFWKTPVMTIGGKSKLRPEPLSPSLSLSRSGTGGTRMVHRRQLFAKLLMLSAEDLPSRNALPKSRCVARPFFGCPPPPPQQKEKAQWWFFWFPYKNKARIPSKNTHTGLAEAETFRGCSRCETALTAPVSIASHSERGPSLGPV